jgi:hypothetical protein
MTYTNLRTAIAAALMMAAGASYAQTTIVRGAYQFPAAPSSSSGPASVQLGDSPVYMTPYLGFAVGRDDNLFLSNGNEKASTVYITSPGFKLDARQGATVFQASYQGQVGRYSQSEDDDYVDHLVHGQFDAAFDRRNFLRLGVDYVRSHDPRGSTDRILSGHPDRYEQASPFATYALGAPGAEGRLEIYGSTLDKRYLNNRQTTAAGDRTNQEFGGAFYWRVMPKTYVLAEARQTQIHYKLPGSPLSADETRYYGGVTWEATAATTGTIKVGRLQRQFKSDEPKFSGTSWEALVTWTPLSYSKFDLYASRQSNESSGLGTFILSSLAGVTWTHAWSSVLTTGLDARYQKDEYQEFNRTDETKALGMKVGYRFRRWLTLGAEYTRTQRDSNTNRFEYDKNLYFLTATASM